MNRTIPRIGAMVVTITVFLFAICLILDVPFVSYLVCMFLSLGCIMMAVGFQYESCEERKVSANVGVAFAVILSIKPDSKVDKWLKYLMILQGVFFIGCFIMPMTGVFTSMANGEAGNGGTIALLGWCAYFIPVGVLACKHFREIQ